jgi:hypothetical protein
MTTPYDDALGVGSVELVEQSLSTPMAEADQPAEAMGGLMGVSAVTTSEADLTTLEVDMLRWPDGGPDNGDVDLTSVEAEDEAAADEGHDDAWVADMERERNVIADVLSSGAAVDAMVRTLEEYNPVPGTVSAMVLELLRGGIEPHDILSQLSPAGAATEPQPELQVPPDETEHFLGGGGAAWHAEEGGSSDDAFEDNEEAAVAPPRGRSTGRRDRAMGRHRGTPPLPPPSPPPRPPLAPPPPPSARRRLALRPADLVLLCLSAPPRP